MRHDDFGWPCYGFQAILRIDTIHDVELQSSLWRMHYMLMKEIVQTCAVDSLLNSCAPQTITVDHDHQRKSSIHWHSRKSVEQSIQTQPVVVEICHPHAAVYVVRCDDAKRTIDCPAPDPAAPVSHTSRQLDIYMCHACQRGPAACAQTGRHGHRQPPCDGCNSGPPAVASRRPGSKPSHLANTALNCPTLALAPNEPVAEMNSPSIWYFPDGNHNKKHHQ